MCNKVIVQILNVFRRDANCPILFTGALRQTELAEVALINTEKEYYTSSHPESIANYAALGSQPCKAAALSGFN